MLLLGKDKACQELVTGKAVTNEVGEVEREGVKWRQSWKVHFTHDRRMSPQAPWLGRKQKFKIYKKDILRSIFKRMTSDTSKPCFQQIFGKRFSTISSFEFVEVEDMLNPNPLVLIEYLLWNRMNSKYFQRPLH